MVADHQPFRAEIHPQLAASKLECSLVNDCPKPQEGHTADTG